MEMTGDPGQIMSNFVKDIGTSSFFTGTFALQTCGSTSGGVKITEIQ